MKIKKRKATKIVIITGIAICAIACVKIASMNSDTSTPFRTDINPEDYGLILNSVEIEIEGVKNDYNYLYMTDNQADFDEREDLGWFGNAQTRTFRDKDGISAAENFQNWIDYANDSHINAMLMGGDIVDFFTEKNMEAVQSHLSQLTMPYLYTYGNHDSYIPWENRFDDENESFLKFFDKNDCEFQVIDEGEFYIVSIRNYQKDGKAQISQTALNQYKKVASEGKPIILVCHVPLYTENASGLKEAAESVYGNVFLQYDAGEFGIVDESLLLGENCGYELTADTQEFLNEVISPDSPCVAILAGHLHTEWKGHLNENIYEYVGAGAFENKGALIHVSGKN